MYMSTFKGGFNSERSSFGLKSSKMGGKSLRLVISLQVDSAQGSDLAPISGDLSHIGKVSEIKPPLVKFIYPEKAKFFCKISNVDLTGTTYDKSTLEISQNFVAFSEYINFMYKVYSLEDPTDINKCP